MKKTFLLLLTLFFLPLEARPTHKKRSVRRTTSSTLLKRSPIKKKLAYQPKKIPSHSPLTRVQLLTDTLNKLSQTADKKTAIGIKVISLKNHSVIFEKKADIPLIPASNAKVFTAGAAYHLLSPESHFETDVYTDNQLSLGKINNIYIKGSGDPTLTSQDLDQLVHRLKEKSVREIKGNIVVDSSIFDHQPVSPGTTKGDGPIFDKSPVAGLMIDHSCITVRVKSTAIGRKPNVYIEPFSSFFKIDNRARTVAHAGKHSLHVSRKPNNTLLITGTISKRQKQKWYRMAIEQPHMHAGHVLLALLRKHKIAIKGAVIPGVVPPQAKLLARHSSEPMKTVIRAMVKKSDNLYSDALFKKMGAKIYGAPGTWEKGKKALEQFLNTTVKMPLAGFILNDGSGLSHANKVSPNHLATFFTWMYKQSPYRDLFVDSLPISGIDGTLRHRMRNKNAHAKVKAKTGSLFGVSSLAGYITSKKSDPLIFVIMINRGNKSAVAYKRKLEDQVCTLLATHAFSTF